MRDYEVLCLFMICNRNPAKTNHHRGAAAAAHCFDQPGGWPEVHLSANPSAATSHLLYENQMYVYGVMWSFARGVSQSMCARASSSLWACTLCDLESHTYCQKPSHPKSSCAKSYQGCQPPQAITTLTTALLPSRQVRQYCQHRHPARSWHNPCRRQCQ